jgi:hypothetical protein
MNINQVNPYQYIDTLNFLPVTQNPMLNTNFTMLKTANTVHNLNLTAKFLDVQDKNGSSVNNTQSGSQFYNAVAMWNTRFIPQK